MTINTATLEAFTQIQNPTLTLLAKTLHHLTEPTYLFILAIIASTYLYLNKQKSQAILLTSASIITAILIKTIKTTIQSPRPISNIILETGYSFPSGHATFAVVFFGLITYIFTKQKYKTLTIITSTTLITIIALSRLYLQVHWLTDIIGALIIGTIILTSAILIDKT